jgi:hypothetical protein
MSSCASHTVQDTAGTVNLTKTEPGDNGIHTWLAENNWSDSGSQDGAAEAAKEMQHTEGGVRKIGLSTILGGGTCMGSGCSKGQSPSRSTPAASPVAVQTGRDTQLVYVSSIYALYKDWCDSMQHRHRGGISGLVNLEKGTHIRTTLDGSLLFQRLAAQRAAEPQKLWLDHLDLGECCKIEV